MTSSKTHCFTLSRSFYTHLHIKGVCLIHEDENEMIKDSKQEHTWSQKIHHNFIIYLPKMYKFSLNDQRDHNCDTLEGVMIILFKLMDKWHWNYETYSFFDPFVDFLAF